MIFLGAVRVYQLIFDFDFVDFKVSALENEKYTLEFFDFLVWILVSLPW